MVAGLPGVGISGIFYLVCAFIMPFVELYNTARGRSNAKRWRVVIRQFLILSFIIASSWAVGLMLVYAFHYVLEGLSSVMHFRRLQEASPFKVQPLLLSFITMSVLFTILSVYNLILNNRASSEA